MGVARQGMATPVLVQEELEVWTQTMRRGLTCGRGQPWLCPFLVLAELGAPPPVGVRVGESPAGPRTAVGWPGRTRGQRRGFAVSFGSHPGIHWGFPGHPRGSLPENQSAWQRGRWDRQAAPG